MKDNQVASSPARSQAEQFVHVGAAGLMLALSLVMVARGMMLIVNPPAPTVSRHVVEALQALDGNMKTLTKKVESLDSQLEAITTPDPKIDPHKQVAAVKAEMKVLSERLDLVDKALTDDPIRALSITLLRDDVQDMKREREEFKMEVEAQINRVYSQNQWFWGTVLTIAGLVFPASVGFLLWFHKWSDKSPTT